MRFLDRSSQAAMILLSVFAPGLVWAQAPSPEPSLDDVRQAAGRFEDVQVALAEGYIRDPNGHCVTAEHLGLPAEEGAMGIHYLRPDLLGITAPGPRVNGTGTHTDFFDPAILIYEPQADGGLALVAIENLVFEKAWVEAGHAVAPSFQGRTWDHMIDDPATEIDEAHGFEPHYDLHLWLFRENSKGAMNAFNPAVSCAYASHAGTQ